MSDVLVFGEANALSFKDVRAQVARIPDVRVRLNEAQSFWDHNVGDEFSFHEYILSDDKTFFSNSSLTSISMALVQLGLFDRYTRMFSMPNVLVGDMQNDSALLVASRVISLNEMIIKSRAYTALSQKQVIPIHKGFEEVSLNGSEIPKYGVYKYNPQRGEHGRYENIGSAQFTLKESLVELSKNLNMTRLIHVGPGQISRQTTEPLGDQVQVVESIDLDPMLSWFWKSIRHAEASA